MKKAATVKNGSTAKKSLNVQALSLTPPPVAMFDTTYAPAITLWAEVNIMDGMRYAESMARLTGNPYTVPVGHRVVIESLSGAMDIPTGQKAFRVSFYAQSKGITKPPHWLEPSLVASDHIKADHYIFDERMIRAVADEFEEIKVAASRTGFVGQTNLRMTMTGYLMRV